MSGRVLGVVLAGGLASRMGGADKGLLSLGGRPLIGRVIERFAPQVDGLVLSANGDPARFATFGLDVLADDISGYPGPLAGLVAAMDRAVGMGFDHVATAAADTPFLPLETVARLKAVAAPVAIAASEIPQGRLQRHPVFGLWPVSLRNDLRHFLGEGQSKVGLFAEQHGLGIAAFPAGTVDPFFNINTPEDLAKAEDLIAKIGQNG